MCLPLPLSMYISKFGGCKRQDSSAKRTPRTNGKFSRRAREEVRKSYSPRAVVCLALSCAVSVARGRGRPRSMGMQTSLCAGFAALRAWRDGCFRSLKRRSARSLRRFVPKTRENLAVGGLFGLSCFRPSFRIVLADVCGPECPETSLCAVFAKIAFSPTRNTKSNTINRPLSNDMPFFILLKNVCSRLRETLL